MRPIFLGSLALSSVMLSAMFTGPSWLDNSQRWIHNLVSNSKTDFVPAEAESQITAILQSGRHEDSRTMLQSDVELHNWLTHRLENVNQVDLQSLANEIQDSCPRYLKLSSTAMQSSTVQGLFEQVTHWDELDDREFTHVAVVARTRPAGLGYECVIFAGQRLNDLVPELISSGRDQFFSICPLCGHGQAGLVLARKRTVFLECPDCHRYYSIVAVDTKGVFHFVSRYLTGYAPPAHFKPGLSRLAEMTRIWGEVVHTIDYVPDSADGIEDNDAWQMAQETERLRTGDCEDSSIYLADWLISRGFEVRVALGSYADRGGHAWVIARLNGNSYLLETTDPKADTTRPPLASQAGALYTPDAMFDREAIYVRRFPGSAWNGDYWSPSQWVKVEPLGTKTMTALGARVTENDAAKPPASASSPH